MDEVTLRKSLTDAGVDADKIDSIVAANKAAVPVDAKVEEVDVADLQKSLDDLKGTLEAAHKGPTEAEVQETIKKAIGDATDSYEKYAKEMAATTDLLVKTVQGEMVELRKGLATAVDAVIKLSGAYESVKKSLDDNTIGVKAVADKDFGTQVTEAVQKALDAAAPLRGKSVQAGDLEVLPHPGDKQDDIKKSLTPDDVKKALAAHPDRVIVNRAVAEIYGSGFHPNPGMVLEKYNIKVAA